MTNGEPGDAPEAQERVVYVERQSNGLAVAALVCGIGGLMIGLFGPPLIFTIPLTVGAIAITLGFMGRRRAQREPAVGRSGMATWGIVLGVLAFACGIWGAAAV